MATTATSSNQGDQYFWDLWLSHFRFPMLAVADEFGFFETIQASGGISLDEAGAALNFPARSTVTLVSFLVAEGFLKYHGQELRLTAASEEFLLRSSPNYWGGMFSGWRHYDLYLEIKAAMLGQSATKVTERWKENKRDDDLTRTFIEAMNSHSQSCAKFLANSGIYRQGSRILDVGGGSGCFSIEALAADKSARATIGELESVVPITQSLVAMRPESSRIHVRAFDFFAGDWLKGHDTVFLSNILHDWSFEACAVIIQNAYQSLPSGGRILIHEIVLNENFDGPSAAAIFSLVMLLRTEGRQWRFSELKSLLTDAGFIKIEINKGLHHFSIIEGTKP
jgi:cyclopropane fatty-acyl-phospholipid synthase-like methyltransferase